jgi:hypothetical protein
MSLTTWTTEQMLGLAPDPLMARAAERLAKPPEWLVLGHNDHLIWGACANPGSAPYHVFSTLPDLSFFCDCPARKRPCRHAVSLALLATREAASFVKMEPPQWVLDNWPAARPDLAWRQPVPTNAEYEEKLQTVKKGMRQFERWLKDTVHQGLSGVPSLPVGLWNEMAARLSDSGAPEVAQDLRLLRPLAGSHPGWPEVLLRRLGRFYLLTQGFAAYDKLPPESQADLRGAAGWFEDPAHPGDERLNDRWLVLGTVHEVQGRHNVRRTWLYGLHHRRLAFVNQMSYKGIPEPAFLSGTALEATLRFSPGGWPQRASIVSLSQITPDNSPIPGSDSLQNARSAYGKALSVNPWLRNFPLVLRGVQPEMDGGQWILRDQQGYLVPLPDPFLVGWHLQVMGGTAGSALFGEWDGLQFKPLAAYHNNSWLTLHILRGQK